MASALTLLPPSNLLLSTHEVFHPADQQITLETNEGMSIDEAEVKSLMKTIYYNAVAKNILKLDKAPGSERKMQDKNKKVIEK